MKYWIGVVSRDHVLKGVEGGFCQVCHGRRAAVSRMKADDWIIYYSPVKALSTSESSDKIETKTNRYQRFVVIGRVKDENIYPHQMFPGSIFFRRDVEYLTNVGEVAIEGLKDKLEFVKNNRNWGLLLRRGLFNISPHDFELIRNAMERRFLDDSGGL